MKLFIVTKSSELLLSSILQTPPYQRTVLTLEQFVEPFKKLGVSSIPIRLSNNFTTADKDNKFFVAAMPGIFGDTTFGSTELPAHKVLGIDRLRFWYYPYPEEITNLVDLIKFDEVVVSFDITNFIPWVVAEHVGKVTAIKTNSILDRQHLDFLKFYTKIHTLVVSYDQEKRFLLKQKIKAKKIVSFSGDIPGRPRPAELREKTTGMYYDSRFDWKAMIMLMQVNLGERKLVIGFPNNTEWKKFLTTFPNISSHAQIELQDVIGLKKCEEVFFPHYDENLIRQFPENVKIKFYDIANTEKALLFNEVLK